MNLSKKLFIGATLLLILSPIFSQSALAEEKNKDGILVNPSIIDLVAEQGEVISSSFNFVNNTDVEQIISLEINSYILSNQTSGSPIFNNEDGSLIQSESKDWFELKKIDSKKVKPGGQEKIEFTVKVPQKAEAKKYYNAIFVNSTPELEKNNNSGNLISYRMGALTILDVKEAPGFFAKFIKVIKNSPVTLILIILALLALALALIRFFGKKGLSFNLNKEGAGGIFEEAKDLKKEKKRIIKRKKK